MLCCCYTDGKHHVVPTTGDLYIYGVEKSDGRAAYRCRTRIATSATAVTSSNAASVIVTGNLISTF